MRCCGTSDARSPGAAWGSAARRRAPRGRRQLFEREVGGGGHLRRRRRVGVSRVGRVRAAVAEALGLEGDQREAVVRLVVVIVVCFERERDRRRRDAPGLGAARGRRRALAAVAAAAAASHRGGRRPAVAGERRLEPGERLRLFPGLLHHRLHVLGDGDGRRQRVALVGGLPSSIKGSSSRAPPTSAPCASRRRSRAPRRRGTTPSLHPAT